MGKSIVYAAMALISLVAMLGLSATTVHADDPTATPTAYYNFIIPGLEIPIILPTSFVLPPKTPIYVHYTPAPNLNPHGLQMDQFALHMIAESINLSQATLDVMGVVGWILDFLIWVWLGGGTILIIANIAKRGSVMWQTWRHDEGSFRDSWRYTRDRVPMRFRAVKPVKFPGGKKKKGI